MPKPLHDPEPAPRFQPPTFIERILSWDVLETSASGASGATVPTTGVPYWIELSSATYTAVPPSSGGSNPSGLLRLVGANPPTVGEVSQVRTTSALAISLAQQSVLWHTVCTPRLVAAEDRAGLALGIELATTGRTGGVTIEQPHNGYPVLSVWGADGPSSPLRTKTLKADSATGDQYGLDYFSAAQMMVGLLWDAEDKLLRVVRMPQRGVIIEDYAVEIPDVVATNPVRPRTYLRNLTGGGRHQMDLYRQDLGFWS